MRRKMIGGFATVPTSVLVVVLSAWPALAQKNWPQWRGPSGTGKTTATAAVAQWNADTNIRWRTELPEPGNSTPVVHGNRIFITQPLAESQQRGLICLDRAGGEELWRRFVNYSAEEPTHRTNPYCSASPVVDDQRVIAWFGSAGLVCWDHDGNELWRRDLGVQTHMWGYGSSPILHDDLCIVNFGPGELEFLIAVDRETGDTVLESRRMGSSSHLVAIAALRWPQKPQGCPGRPMSPRQRGCGTNPPIRAGWVLESLMMASCMRLTWTEC